MSILKNRELSSWKDVLARLRRRETTWKGIPLSDRDHATFTEAVLLAGMVLSDLSNRYEGCGTFRDHVLWCTSCTDTDVSDLAAFLSATILQLRSYTEEKALSFNSFKRCLPGDHAKNARLLAPMKGAIISFLNDPNPHTLYAPYQFFSFLTHLSLEDLDMGSTLEDEFLKNEEFVSQHRVPDFLVSRMREVMEEWFHDFRVDEDRFDPCHGPGSVAELRADTSLVSKYRLLKPDRLMREVFRRCAHIDLSTYLPFENVGITTRQSQIVFVPKSMKTKRVISKEPATLMYFQQSINKQVDRYVRRHPHLSKHIDLHDQCKQRDLALYASRTRQFATVDLSAASDSVSYDLVKRVFAGTRLYPYLVALRSETVRLPSGKVIQAAKYAPMGSALCFPVESLIFACICECTVRYVKHVTGESFSQYRVYGDDIIIPDPCLEDLVSNLRLAGFRINEDKTYGGNHRFRESCGCDAYDGVDVTPMKIGRKFASRQVHVRSASAFRGLIDMANHAYVYDLRLLRRYLIDRLINETGWVPLFDTEGRRGLISDSVTNYRTPVRWNDRYHCLEYRFSEPLTFSSRASSHVMWDTKHRKYREGEPSELAENVMLWEWLRQARTRSGDPLADDYLVHVTAGSTGTYISKRWIVESKVTVGGEHREMLPGGSITRVIKPFTSNARRDEET